MGIDNGMVTGLLALDAADRVFQARADATRRENAVRTLDQQPSLSTLTRGSPMSFAVVQKHVAVLDRAGLVTGERHGRDQLVGGNPARPRRAQVLLVTLAVVWTQRIDRVGKILADDPRGTTPT